MRDAVFWQQPILSTARYRNVLYSITAFFYVTQYNPYETPMNNIGLPDSLLSRFDLLFIVLDKVGKMHCSCTRQCNL